MLVLSRRENQKIVIDENITIEILSIGKSVCRIGIVAPVEVKVLRSELAERNPPCASDQVPSE